VTARTLGAHTIDLSPLITGTASATDPGGLFCPLQATAGCFGSGACRTINESGAAAGPLTTGTPASTTLVSVFCIAAEGGLLDASFNVPGPGAVALPGTFPPGAQHALRGRGVQQQRHRSGRGVRLWHPAMRPRSIAIRPPEQRRMPQRAWWELADVRARLQRLSAGSAVCERHT